MDVNNSIHHNVIHIIISICVAIYVFVYMYIYIIASCSLHEKQAEDHCIHQDTKLRYAVN